MLHLAGLTTYTLRKLENLTPTLKELLKTQYPHQITAMSQDINKTLTHMKMMFLLEGRHTDFNLREHLDYTSQLLTQIPCTNEEQIKLHETLSFQLNDLSDFTKEYIEFVDYKTSQNEIDLESFRDNIITELINGKLSDNKENSVMYNEFLVNLIRFQTSARKKSFHTNNVAPYRVLNPKSEISYDDLELIPTLEVLTTSLLPYISSKRLLDMSELFLFLDNIGTGLMRKCPELMDEFPQITNYLPKDYQRLALHIVSIVFCSIAFNHYKAKKDINKGLVNLPLHTITNDIGEFSLKLFGFDYSDDPTLELFWNTYGKFVPDLLNANFLDYFVYGTAGCQLNFIEKSQEEKGNYNSVTYPQIFKQEKIKKIKDEDGNVVDLEREDVYYTQPQVKQLYNLLYLAMKVDTFLETDYDGKLNPNSDIRIKLEKLERKLQVSTGNNDLNLDLRTSFQKILKDLLSTSTNTVYVYDYNQSHLLPSNTLLGRLSERTTELKTNLENFFKTYTAEDLAYMTVNDEKNLKRLVVEINFLSTLGVNFDLQPYIFDESRCVYKSNSPLLSTNALLNDINLLEFYNKEFSELDESTSMTQASTILFRNLDCLQFLRLSYKVRNSLRNNTLTKFISLSQESPLSNVSVADFDRQSTVHLIAEDKKSIYNILVYLNELIELRSNTLNTRRYKKTFNDLLKTYATVLLPILREELTEIDSFNKGVYQYYGYTNVGDAYDHFSMNKSKLEPCYATSEEFNSVNDKLISELQDWYTSLDSRWFFLANCSEKDILVPVL